MEVSIVIVAAFLTVSACLGGCLVALCLACSKAHATARYMAERLVEFNVEHRDAKRIELETSTSEVVLREARERDRNRMRRHFSGMNGDAKPDLAAELPTE